MAYGLLEQADIYQSIRYYERALGFIRQHDMRDPAYLDYVIKPLTNNYIRIDDNQKAIQLLKKTIDEIPHNDYARLAGFAGNLATAYIFNGEHRKAEELLINTLKHPIPDLLKGFLCNILSSSLKADYEQSNHYNQLAIAAFANHKLSGDTLIWYTAALTQHAELHDDLPSAERALVILRQNFAETQFRAKAKVQQTIADILYKQDNFHAAKKRFKETIATFTADDRYLLDYTYTQALVGLARCYRQLGQTDSALYYFQWGIENDFRTQQLITSKRNQLHNNIWNRDIIQEMIPLVDQELLHRPNDQNLMETLLWCIELSKGRLLINEINRSENWDNANPAVKEAIRDIRELHKQIAQSDQASEKRKLYSQIQQKLIDFQLSERYFETLRYIPNRDNFLKQLNDRHNDYFSYFVHNDKTISLIGKVNHNYIYHRITDSLFISKLQQFKQNYFSNSPNRYNLNPREYQDLAFYFAQELLPGIAHAAEDIHLSLDGDLYGLPFDALYMSGFLVETHNFAYLNSFILYDLLPTVPTAETEIALLYRSSFPDPLPDLNFVKEEVRNISNRFFSHNIAPPDQHDSTIVQLFAESRAIHIAAHTLLDSTENPILYLQQPISTEQLRFYHIQSPMIFLSACNTGSGRSLPSEGMESIQRIFLSKGVPSVISTYWFANDEAMLRLTSLFYDELYICNQPAEALARAKRKFLQTASVEQQNPWYWSNINYTGVGNKIGLRKSSNLSVILFIGLSVLIGLTLLLFLRFRGVFRDDRRKQRNLR
jgi:CHAT domain-containing protein/lipopolysaccharide biosynthesis regulator YciM